MKGDSYCQSRPAISVKNFIVILINHAGRPYMVEMSGKTLESVLEQVRAEDTNTIFQVLLFP